MFISLIDFVFLLFPSPRRGKVFRSFILRDFAPKSELKLTSGHIETLLLI